MHIDSYQFGQIVIDGTSYNSDCLLIKNAVHSDWWRKHGHTLSPDDLDDVIAAQPDVLVVGCGDAAYMEIPDHTVEFLREQNIRLEADNTHKAVRTYNSLAAEHANVAAALHITC